MADLYGIILAGGASSRFWPLSGDEHPKYLLKPDGEHSLLQLAFDRALACTARERVFVVTNASQSRRIALSLPGLSTDNLLIEPARRDTAAAIALACREIGIHDPNAHMLVLPADQILDPAKALSEAVKLARNTPDFSEFIHVFAIKPRRAEGAFGYIEIGEAITERLHKVASFKEKPGEDAAKRLLENRRNYWNAGCFLFALPAFDRELNKHLPSHSSRLRPAADGMIDVSSYEQLEPVSIDFGLLEHCIALRAVLLDADFDDIGTWDALLARLEKSNRPARQALSALGGGNTVIAEGGELIGVVGLFDVLVIVSDKRVLVLKKGAGQGVKEIARLSGDA